MALADADTRMKQLKKAIVSIAQKRGYSTFTYWKVTNDEIFDWMLDHSIGTQWISVARITNLRQVLPNMYKERLK